MDFERGRGENPKQTKTEVHAEARRGWGRGRIRTELRPLRGRAQTKSKPGNLDREIYERREKQKDEEISSGGAEREGIRKADYFTTESSKNSKNLGPRYFPSSSEFSPRLGVFA